MAVPLSATNRDAHSGAGVGALARAAIGECSLCEHGHVTCYPERRKLDCLKSRIPMVVASLHTALGLAAGVVKLPHSMPGCLVDVTVSHVLKDGEFVPPCKAGVLAGFCCTSQGLFTLHASSTIYVR